MSIGPNVTSFNGKKASVGAGCGGGTGFSDVSGKRAQCVGFGAKSGQVSPAVLYRVVLKIELPWLNEVIAAKATRRLPVVLTPIDARRLLESTSGTMGLIVALLDALRPVLYRGWKKVLAASIYQAYLVIGIFNQF